MNREIELKPSEGNYYRAMAFHWFIVAVAIVPVLLALIIAIVNPFWFRNSMFDLIETRVNRLSRWRNYQKYHIYLGCDPKNVAHPQRRLEMTMPAGRYYIGDLCYVMHNEWKECCELFFPYVPGQTYERQVEGEFTLADGRRFASFGTAYGDGSYRSNIGADHSVDSGSIGCIRVEDIQDKTYDLERLVQLGAIVDFEQPFEVEADYGLLKFGHVQIETAADEEEYEEEEV